MVRPLQAAVPASDHHQYVNSASQKSQACFGFMYTPLRHVTVGNSPLVLTAGAVNSNTQGVANTFPFPPAPSSSVILDIAVMERLKETLLKRDEK